jgi:hypothetical protein
MLVWLRSATGIRQVDGAPQFAKGTAVTRAARTSLVLTVLFALSLVAAGPAAAGGIDASKITTPADGTFFTSDPAAMITIAGTAEGDDILDLRCYAGQNNPMILQGVPVVNGTFSVQVHANLFTAHSCLLKAVAQGDSYPHPPPGDPEYQGARIGGGQFSIQHFVGSGNPTEYWNWAQAGLTADVDLYDAGTCGVANQFLFDPVTLVTGPTLWACADYFDQAGSGAGSTRSGIQVDGKNAYLARSWFANSNFPHTDPKPPTLQVVAHTLDPRTGAVTVDEVQRPSQCGPSLYPPSAAICSPAQLSTVQLARRTQTLDGGRVVRITDTWTSTDGQPHQLDLLAANSQNAATSAAFRFPGDGAVTVRSAGATVPIGGTGPAQILVQEAVGNAGGLSGAVVMDPAPTDARFESANDWHLHTAVTVPGSGAFVQHSDWITAPTQAAAQALAAKAADGRVVPTIAIATPANGATVTSSPVTVTGTSSNGGFPLAVTVNGVVATVAAGGAWTAKVPVALGVTTLKAVATDSAGNTATASRTVRRKDATAPALSAVSLSPKTFRLGAKPTPVAGAAKAKTKAGTTIRWTVSEAGVTTFTVRSAKPGRRRGARCVTARKAKKTAKRCTILGKAKTLQRTTTKAGRHTLPFSGRIGTKRLAVGTYQLAVQASDAAGNRSTARTVAFRVVRK